ncbi:MAG: PEP-CTERM sorting domain-containing protein [Isosphaeraceae bacterium]
MKVHDAGIALGLDPGGLQVDRQHFVGRPLGHPLEDRPSRGFEVKPGDKPISQGMRERLNGFSAVIQELIGDAAFATVPEPSSLTLVLIAAPLLLAWRRRAAFTSPGLRPRDGSGRG